MVINTELLVFNRKKMPDTDENINNKKKNKNKQTNKTKHKDHRVT
jgi:hypothetical protein